MTTDINNDHEGKAGASDATPGGLETKRRPGELAFAAFLLIASLYLLYSAYGISAFEALSAPGSVPMATTFVMVIAAAIVTVKTARLSRTANETLSKNILPGTVLIFIGFMIAFGVLLKPLGFLPTAALFLTAAIKMLMRRGWGYTLTVSLGSLLVIWLLFRIVFSVLLPNGIVPEAEFIQIFRDLLGGGR